MFAPALALIVWMIFARRRDVPGAPQSYGQHLVFALHSLAFVWLVLALWGIIVAVFTEKQVGAIGLIAVIALLLASPIYLFLATRRVYVLSRLSAFALTLALIGVFVALLSAYRSMLFFTTYYTL